MATGTQVPFTDPGSTKCCCGKDCFTDLSNQYSAPYTTGRWVDISQAHFDAFLAGGTWKANISGSLSGWTITTSPVRNQVDIATINASNVALSSVASDSWMGGLPTNDAPCFDTLRSSLFNVARSCSGYTFNPSPDTIQTELNIAIGFGSDNSFSPVKRKIQVMMLDVLAFQYRAQNSFYTLQCGNLSSITNSLPYRSQSATPPTATLAVKIGSTTYPAVTVYVKRKFGLSSTTLNYITGSISVELVFTPSAP